MERKQLIRFWLLLLVLCLSLGQGELVLGCSDGNCPGQAQIDWIISMQDPITGLVDSYQDDGLVNAYIFDQALAVIALTDSNRITEAQSILDRMQDYQRDDPNDGVWYVAYRVGIIDPNWPPGDCQYFRTGDIAWMVMAVNFYECRTGDPTYANMARRALGWMDTMRHTNDPNDGRYGSLRYSSINPNIISTEHNLDAYSAYYWRGMLDANDSHLYKASLILDYLRREMWAPSPNSNCDQYANCNHDVKIFWEGYNSFLFATDCQSWGVLALGPIGPDGEEFYKSLYWLLDNPYGTTRTTHDYNDIIQNVSGFRSYVGIRELCLPDLWWYSDDPSRVWVDGTEHVAAALFSIGDDPNGIYFHNEMGKIVDPNGGLVHSFSEDPDNEYRYNYIASAAWYYFNEVRLNPFNLRPCFAECRAANIDGTGRINLQDYAILASYWLEKGLGLAGDINRDRRVQRADLNILTSYWLSDCNE